MSERRAHEHQGVAQIPYATPAPPRRPSPLLRILALAVVGMALLVIGLWLARRVTVTVSLNPPAPAAPPAPVAPRAMPAPPPVSVAPPPPPPPVLDLPTGPSRLTVQQRRAEAIPGSFGTVFIRLDDITGGRVRLDVATSGGQVLARRTVRPGDAVEFKLDGSDYVVAVAPFHLSLTGTDRGEFIVRRASDPPTHEERIGRLIDAAAKSGAFVVLPTADGSEPQAKAADEYLRDVWLFRKPRSATAEELARRAARPSGSATAPPRVRLRDGTEATLDVWLAAELAKLK